MSDPVADTATTTAAPVKTGAPEKSTPVSSAGKSTGAGTSGAGKASSPAGAPRFFGEHSNEDGTFKQGWTTPLAEKFPRLANTAQRYKTEGEFFQGLDNALGLIGKKTPVTSGYPKEGASAEEVSAFRAEAGVPHSPQEYLLRPEALPDGVEWDEAMGEKFSELMHAHHIPAVAAQALVAAHLESVVDQQEGLRTSLSSVMEEMVKKTTAEFQREWGVDYEARHEANNDFISARMKPEDLANPALRVALSNPALIRIIDEARRASRETRLPGMKNGAAVASLSARQQGLEIMKQNPDWRRDSSLVRKVNDLYAQDAAARNRRR